MSREVANLIHCCTHSKLEPKFPSCISLLGLLLSMIWQAEQQVLVNNCSTFYLQSKLLYLCLNSNFQLPIMITVIILSTLQYVQGDILSLYHFNYLLLSDVFDVSVGQSQLYDFTFSNSQFPFLLVAIFQHHQRMWSVYLTTHIIYIVPVQ